MRCKSRGWNQQPLNGETFMLPHLVVHHPACCSAVIVRTACYTKFLL